MVGLSELETARSYEAATLCVVLAKPIYREMETRRTPGEQKPKVIFLGPLQGCPRSVNPSVFVGITGYF